MAVETGGFIQRELFKYERDFTQIKNSWLRDRRLSFRARGILAILLSYPPKTKISVKILSDSVEGIALPNKKLKSGESRDAIKTAINELEAVGYLVRTTSRHYGQFQVEWLMQDPEELLVGLFEEPQNHRDGKSAPVHPKPVDNSPHRDGKSAHTVTENPSTINNTINTLKEVNKVPIDRAREKNDRHSADSFSADSAPGCGHHLSPDSSRHCIYGCLANFRWREANPEPIEVSR